ncbi:MAG: prohibitin family protein [Zoogloeaceae bacterium]|jgi:regulator of protease activity HflC (stomatin/prohibitin superfamily)|nr:prohibitin family protein [Zoogloeaceae bacterium]
MFNRIISVIFSNERGKAENGSVFRYAPLVAIAAIAAVVLIAASYYTIEQGYRGIALRFGEVYKVAEPGLNFKIPFIDNIWELEVRTQKDARKIEAYSKDSQPVDMAISINFHLNAGGVGKIYSDYGINYRDRLIEPKLMALPKDTIGKYAAIELVQNRDMVSKQILDDLIAYFTPLGIIVESLNIENIDFSQAYEASVEQRMQAEVEVQKVKQNLERERLNAEMVRVQAQGEADAKVAQAKAESEAIMLRGAAEAKAIEQKAKALALNPSLVKLYEAEKWDGKLPETMIPNQSIPVIGGK